jgi:hypothetical protein
MNSKYMHGEKIKRQIMLDVPTIFERKKEQVRKYP